MQRAKLFAYVNKCVGNSKKRFNSSVTHGLRKEHVLRSLPPLIFDKVKSYMQIISHDTLR
jgi:hypothetical protein